MTGLKPQDSFGKKDKTFSWSAESAAHGQKTLIYLPALVLNDVFSCNNVKWLNIAMYITYGRVFGGDSEHFDIWVIFWKWKQFGVNNEQGIYSSYRSIKSCIDKKNNVLIFHHIPKLSCDFKYECLPIAYQFYSFSRLQILFSSFFCFILNDAFSILNDLTLYKLWAYFMQTFLSIFLRLELDKCCAWEAKSGK